MMRVVITFSRAQATWYLAAFAVWVAGFAVIALSAAHGSGSRPGGAVAGLLSLMFAACGSMAVVAFQLVRSGAAYGDDERIDPRMDGGRFFVLLNLLWLLLLMGAGLPAAFRATDPGR